MTSVVVHWLNENKPGVTDIMNVLVGDRKEGAVSMVKHGSKRFPARVVMITGQLTVLTVSFLFFH